MANLALAFDLLVRGGDKAARDLDKVGDAADRTGKRGEKFGKAMGAGIAAAGLAIAGFAASSVKAFAESEESAARLDAALGKFPRTNDVTRESFDRLNEALAKKTRFDDDATASAQAVLAQFELTGQQIQQLTPLMQDYAAKTGRDLPTAAEALGKAIMGQGRALKDVGIDFTDTGTAAGNFEQLVGNLRTQVGGFAEVEGKTAAGQAEILRNRFGELQEQVGAKLTPVLSDLAEKLLDVFDWMEKNEGKAEGLALAVGGLALSIVAVNTALKANPLVAAASALLAVGGAFAYAYDQSEFFRRSVGNLVDVLRDVWRWVSKVGKAIEESWLGDFAGGASQFLSGGASFFGRNALGGHVGANTPYLVGERGPELFVPQSTGSIVPTGGFTINGGVHLNRAGDEQNAVALSRGLRNLAWTMG